MASAATQLHHMSRFCRTEKPEGPAAPPVSFTMALNTTSYSVSRSDEVPELSFTITSHFVHPITICTYGTVLDARTAWTGNALSQNFVARDLDTFLRVAFPTEHLCRGVGLRRRLGDTDERYFVTLMPNIPYKVSYKVHYFARWKNRNSAGRLTKAYASNMAEDKEVALHFEPEHRYGFGLQYKTTTFYSDRPPDRGPVQVAFWWRYGPKEEVLAPRKAPMSESRKGWSEKEIQFGDISEIEISIEA